MPEYLAPGVYMEEFEIGARPIEGVSTSTAGFLGLTERGPSKVPKAVTSFADFTRFYGGYMRDSYMAYAVEGFFSNGGKRCFIGRIVHEGAVESKKPVDGVVFTAAGPGAWGNRVAVRIQNASNDPENTISPDGKKFFQLIVAYWKDKIPEDLAVPEDKEKKKRKFSEITEKAVVEIFDNLSEDPESADHYVKKLSDPLKNPSNLIFITKDSTGRPANTEGSFFIPLEGGSEGAAELSRSDFRSDPDAKPGDRKGLSAFEEIDEISIIYVPDIHVVKEGDSQTLLDDILTHCELLKDRFAIIDVPQGENNIGGLTIRTFSPRFSKYAAAYYPWIKISDPLTKKQELKPPGGYIAGIYARSDTDRGVHKAPANEVVRGAIDLEYNITKGEHDFLNPRGINVIRNFPARGILVWGARTAIIDPLWKYINVRRLFIYVEESIEEGTQWVVFEPNDEKLWARVRATITQFLTRVWKDGALMGTKAEQAFFVKCDRTTMTQDDIDNGRLICVIGIAPVKPAEFVIFRIAQWQGGSAATE
ncbi:MAG: phage tail sheath C-terminal domain-containing protein [Candidatus Methanoperedens sp.]